MQEAQALADPLCHLQKERKGICGPRSSPGLLRARRRGGRAPVLLKALLFHMAERVAPFPAALQYRVDAWSEWSKPLLQLPVSKIRLIFRPLIGDISDIKLIRTDTTLDLSQKAEKR